ncbi:ATPase AAA, partial [Orpheovirus IHUMI-LCC2]
LFYSNDNNDYINNIGYVKMINIYIIYVLNKILMDNNVIFNFNTISQLIPLLIYKEGNISFKTILLFIINNFFPKIEKLLKDFILKIITYYKEKYNKLELNNKDQDIKVKLEVKEYTQVTWYFASNSKCNKYFSKPIPLPGKERYDIEIHSSIDVNFEQKIIYFGNTITSRYEKLSEKDGQYTEYICILEGKSIDILKKFLQHCYDEYSNYKVQLDKKKEKFVCPNIYNMHNFNSSPVWSIGKLYVTKTFDNVIMDEVIRNNIIHKLDSLNDETYYRKIGKPIKCAFLFYGIPGCGKSSTIYAIANYMKMDIHNISLDKVRDIDIEGIIKNLEGTLLVLEEVDLQRYKREGNDKDDGVTIKTLLRILDAYEYLHKCVIIMTTNYINNIDPALIRPGRIDCKVEFKKASTKMIHDVIKLYLDVECNVDLSVYNGMFTTSQLMQILEVSEDLTSFLSNLQLYKQ